MAPYCGCSLKYSNGAEQATGADAIADQATGGSINCQKGPGANGRVFHAEGHPV
jgi:hypothetical protein